MCMEKNKYCGFDPNDMNVEMLSTNSLSMRDLSEDTCADWCTRQNVNHEGRCCLYWELPPGT